MKITPKQKENWKEIKSGEYKTLITQQKPRTEAELAHRSAI